MPSHSIRVATPDDAPVLAQLRFDFRASVNQATEDEGEFVKRCAEWMAVRLAAHSQWHCWVVEANGGIGGQLWVELVEKIPNPAPELERHAYITNVYVSAVARGSGAGEGLLEAALAFCRAECVDSVVLWPTDRSRSLYARHGFAVRDDLMEAILDGNRHV